MADLDDFFAKKDKKKSKKKTGNATEELVKTNANEKPTTAPPVKKKQPVEQNEGIEVQEEDEWKEIEEERRDYSGLKIGQLTINDNEQDEDYQDGDQADGDSTSGTAKGQHDPWKKSHGNSNETVGKPTTAATVVESGPQVYISPAMKNARLRAKGIAPDLSDEKYFPSLGAEKQSSAPLKKGTQFEEIKQGHGGRPKQAQSNAPFATNNRFISLDTDGS